MNEKLWEASEKTKNKSNLFKYEKFLQKNYNYKYSLKFNKLLKWSINNSNEFWGSIWDYSKVKGKKSFRFKHSKNLINSRFLIGSKLNFAENLLSKDDKKMNSTRKEMKD